MCIHVHNACNCWPASQKKKKTQLYDKLFVFFSSTGSDADPSRYKTLNQCWFNVGQRLVSAGIVLKVRASTGCQRSRCQNGGRCVDGRRPGFEDMDDSPEDASGQDPEDEDMSYHCVCRDGYAGWHCEIGQLIITLQCCSTKAKGSICLVVK